MSNTTGIEWTDATWNPIRGCSRVSEGCRNCYAEKVAYRFSGPGQPYEGLVQVASRMDGYSQQDQRLPKWNGQIKFVEEHLLDPLRWKPVLAPCVQCGLTKTCVCPGRNIAGPIGPLTRPRRIFVNSMSDLFHENVTDEMLDRIFAVMALCPQHTFQVLTKRPERMRKYLTPTMSNYQPANIFDAADEILNAHATGNYFDRAITWALPNVWLGVSVENQKAADERIPLLLQTPAAVRFLSVEPLLGPVTLAPVADNTYQLLSNWYGPNGFDPTGSQPTKTHREDYFPKVDWVICGGESGPGARPMHPDWARGLRAQCVAAGVPFFFKQWGEWHPGTQKLPRPGDNARHGWAQPRHCRWVQSDGTAKEIGKGQLDLGRGDELMVRVGKKAAGQLLDGREWNEFPEAAMAVPRG